MPKNQCLQTLALAKTPENPLDSKEIKPVNLKGDQSWIFTGRTDVEAEAPVFWSSDVNRWLTGKVPDAGKDRGQKKRVSEDEMAGWHHRCNGHELGQTPGNGEGQGGLVCCSPWGHKESEMTERLNNNRDIVSELYVAELWASQNRKLWAVSHYWPTRASVKAQWVYLNK